MRSSGTGLRAFLSSPGSRFGFRLGPIRLLERPVRRTSRALRRRLGPECSAVRFAEACRGRSVMRTGRLIGVLAAAALCPGVVLCGETSEDLVRDGGFEEVREVSVGLDAYVLKHIQNGLDLGSPGPVVRLPANAGQFCGCRRLHVVEGEPGEAVHTGRRAIVLDGSFYLNAGGPASTGDVFRARYYAKGKGTVRLILPLYNREGKYYGQAVPKPFPLDTGTWTLVEHVLDTRSHADLGRIGARLESKGDISVDDLSLVKTRDSPPSGGGGPVPIAFAALSSSGVTVDGKLTEECWTRASLNGPFVQIYDNSKVSEPLTFFRAAYDKDAVYLGVEAKEPSSENLKSEKSAHDVWPSGSTIELFLDTDCDRSSYYQLAANIAGSRFDQFGKDTSWDTDWSVALQTAGNRWTMEVAIPFRDLQGGAPQPGGRWGINLCRNRQGDLAYSSSWARVGRAFHRPGLFNTLIFGTVQQWWTRQAELRRNTGAELRRQLESLDPRDGALERKLDTVERRCGALAPPARDMAPDTPGLMALYEAAQLLQDDMQAVADETEMLLAIRKATGPRK